MNLWKVFNCSCKYWKILKNRPINNKSIGILKHAFQVKIYGYYIGEYSIE